MLLWPAAAALIRPLAWEPPYAPGAALKKPKKKKKERKEGRKPIKEENRKERKLKWNFRSSRCGSAETNLTRNHEVAGSIAGFDQWVKDLVLP